MFCWVGDELYIPAFAAGLSNMQALVLTGYEWGEHVLMVKNALLVKERWLWKMFPKYRKTYKLIRKTAIKAMIPAC